MPRREGAEITPMRIRPGWLIRRYAAYHAGDGRSEAEATAWRRHRQYRRVQPHRRTLFSEEQWGWQSREGAEDDREQVRYATGAAMLR